jgi:hypothetical protein
MCLLMSMTRGIDLFLTIAWRLSYRLVSVQLWVLSLSFLERVPVSVLHQIHHLCQFLLRWIPLPHTFWLCHPRTGLKQYRLFVCHHLLQLPLADLTRHIHRILRTTSLLLPWDLVLHLWLLTWCVWLRWMSCVHNWGDSGVMIWYWSCNPLLRLLIVKDFWLWRPLTSRVVTLQNFEV